MAKVKKPAETPQSDFISENNTETVVETPPGGIDTEIDQAAVEKRKAEAVQEFAAAVRKKFADHEMFPDVNRILNNQVAAEIFYELVDRRLRKQHDPTGGKKEIQTIVGLIARPFMRIERITAEAERRMTNATH